MVELPILAGIPTSKSGDGQNAALASLNQPRSPAAESYRSLRTAVTFWAVDVPAKALLITSPSPGEGKSTTVANLGVAMAQAGKRVLIIDADLRKTVPAPTLQSAVDQGLSSLVLGFELSRTAGLTSVRLPPGSRFESSIFRTRQESLFVFLPEPYRRIRQSWLGPRR